MCSFLLNDFHIYAVDTIGHSGKSDEVCLSHKGYDYGKWAYTHFATNGKRTNC